MVKLVDAPDAIDYRFCVFCKWPAEWDTREKLQHGTYARAKHPYVYICGSLCSSGAEGFPPLAHWAYVG